MAFSFDLLPFFTLPGGATTFAARFEHNTAVITLMENLNFTSLALVIFFVLRLAVWRAIGLKVDGSYIQ
jgi:hypothetical protein